MIILLCILVSIIYINFQQSKLKIEEGFNLKNIRLKVNSSIDYLIDKQDDIKDFYYTVSELKEDKVTLKALENRPYMDITLKGEKDDMELKLYDGNVVYKNKVYGGKAVDGITKLLEKQIASEKFIVNYLNYANSIKFKFNELQKSFGRYTVDFDRTKGDREELINYFKGGKFKIANKEKVKKLEIKYPSFNIVAKYSNPEERVVENINLINDEMMSITLNNKNYYIETDRSGYDFVSQRLPKYELSDLGDLLKATSVKDKDTGDDLTSSINWLTQVLTQNMSTENTEAPSKSKHTVVYNINGKNEEVTIHQDKIIFREKEYVVNNVGKSYEVGFLDTKEEKDKNKVSKSYPKNAELKDGEYILSLDGLLYTRIKDKDDIKYINDIFDNIYKQEKAIEKEREYSPNYTVSRNVDGKQETIAFYDNDIMNMDNSKLIHTKDPYKLVDKYMPKIQDLKSLKELAGKIDVWNYGYTTRTTLSNEKNKELLNILSKSKMEVFEIKSPQGSDMTFKIRNEANIVFNIYNGKQWLNMYAHDDKIYIMPKVQYAKNKAFVFSNTKDITKFINTIQPRQVMLKSVLPINKGQEVTLKYNGKTINSNNKRNELQRIIWENSDLYLEDNKSLTDIADKDIVVTFEYKDDLNTIKINKDGVYQNGTLIYSGRYYINLIYNKLVNEFKL